MDFMQTVLAESSVTLLLGQSAHTHTHTTTTWVFITEVVKCKNPADFVCLCSLSTSQRPQPLMLTVQDRLIWLIIPLRVWIYVIIFFKDCYLYFACGTLAWQICCITSRWIIRYFELRSYMKVYHLFVFCNAETGHDPIYHCIPLRIICELCITKLHDR